MALESAVSCTIAFFVVGVYPSFLPILLSLPGQVTVLTLATRTPNNFSTAILICVLFAAFATVNV